MIAAREAETFVLLTDAQRAAYAEVEALTRRLGRTFSGRYTTPASIEAAQIQAGELADAAHALATQLNGEVVPR